MNKCKNVGADASVRPFSKVGQNKGITLIALVITIIVMLILVAVTISMAINGGLFDYAGKATGETQNAINAEQALANGKVQVDGKWYASIDDYIKGNEIEEHNWTREGDTFTCSICNATYTMGQVLNYTPDGKTSTTITAEKSGMNDDQTIEVQSTKWVVLGIEDTNDNGTNDALLITTINPVGVNSEYDSLYFNGAAAYNNGPDEINRICKELYSNSEYGIARGMTIEDANSTLNYTPIGGMYYDGGNQSTGNLTTKLKDLSIWDSIKAYGTKTPDGTNTEEELGEYELNGYSYYTSGDDDLTLIAPIYTKATTITEIEKNIVFGSYTGFEYWLASRGVGAKSSSIDGLAQFGSGSVVRGSAYSYGYYNFISSGLELENYAKLRPVVPLESKIPETSSEVINWEDYDEVPEE